MREILGCWPLLGLASMESESLVDADNGHTSNDYHAVEDAGVHGPKYTQKTVLGKVRVIV